MLTCQGAEDELTELRALVEQLLARVNELKEGRDVARQKCEQLRPDLSREWRP